MFEWLGDLFSGIGDTIGGAFDGIGESISNTIFNSILQWLYEIIYGAISDFFEMISRWIYNKGIQVQIVLKVLSVKAAMSVKKHFE